MLEKEFGNLMAVEVAYLICLTPDFVQFIDDTGIFSASIIELIYLDHILTKVLWKYFGWRRAIRRWTSSFRPFTRPSLKALKTQRY